MASTLTTDHHPSPKISTTFGIKDDVFRIFASQLLCYLFGIVYNGFCAKRSVPIKHAFNLTTGLVLVYYNFGLDVGHSLGTVLLSWSIMKLLGPTQLMVGLNFVAVLGYLLYGYYVKESSTDVTFTWTLPQCVLTLSLIAQAFDVYDGAKNVKAKAKGREKKTDDKPTGAIALVNEDTALEALPTLLETFSKSFFPPTVLIGPQVRFKDYLAYMESTENLLPFCWKQSLLRFTIGLLYYAIYTAGLSYIAGSYFTSPAFASHCLPVKLAILAFYNKIVLCKYLSAWLISEGGCLMYGISRDPLTGLMNRCFNISVLQYETTATFGGLIESFNMTTNAFAMRYIFKRLKWLKSKLASQFGTLFFLAIWHGFCIGYYNTFALEMAIMKMEKDVAGLVVKWRTRNAAVNGLLNNGPVRCLVYLAMRLHVVLMFSYAFTSFGFLDMPVWKVVLAELSWCGHWLYLGWMLLSVLAGF